MKGILSNGFMLSSYKQCLQLILTLDTLKKFTLKYD